MHSCATSPPGPQYSTGIVRCKPPRDVVGGEDRALGRGAQPVAAHHRDVHPRDRQDRRAAVGRGGHRADRVARVAPPGNAMARQERREMRLAPRPGPTPGPPPPCGMQNVLCRLRCETSAPNWPGAASPTSAFRFAPSTYTWPPCACTISQMRVMPASNTPCVDGYVTMIAARLRACARGLRLEVGEVDVAVLVAGDDDDLHAGHLRRRRIGAVRRRGNEAHVAMRLRRGSRDTRGSSSSPAYSPCEPALGCSDTAS